MYTSVNKRYLDLLRTWHKKSLEGLPRNPQQQQQQQQKEEDDGNTKKSKSAAGTMQSTIAEMEKFPPYIDPTEDQEMCIDPIRALAIPRSRYHSIKELVLCRKNITQIHSNIQLLKNLDTLIIRHNRLSKIEFLLPKKNSVTTKSVVKCNENNMAAAIPYDFSRGCRLLRHLYASHNRLQTLEGDVPNLRHLEVLLLAHNSLSNLRAVSAQLKPLRHLKQLDLRGNPLCDELDYRLFLIHEHPHIEVLDRRMVRESERKEAEEHFGVAGKTRCAHNTAAQELQSTTTDVVELKKTSNDDKEEATIVKVVEGLSLPSILLSSPQRQEQDDYNNKEEGEEKEVGGGKTCKPCSKESFASGDEVMRKKVAFLSTFTESASRDDPSTKLSRGLFKPSVCESLLENRMRQIERKKQKQTQEQLAARKKAEDELCEKHQAFHATWVMSSHKMLFSSDNAECSKSLETFSSPAQTFADATVSSNQRTTQNHKSSASRQHGGKPSTKTTARNNSYENLTFECKQLELPRLVQTGGHSDHSVLFDALLGRSTVVEARIGQNKICLPEDCRLERMNKVLTLTNEFLQQQQQHAGSSGSVDKQIALSREISQKKDALIPEPWEHLSTKIQSVIKAAEQVEYINMIARSLFLSTELGALEGQFMMNVTDTLQTQEVAQRGKKQQRKEKRSTIDAQRTTAAAAAMAANSALTSPAEFSNPLWQRWPSFLAATNVEIGQPEKANLMRVINMLDGKSGVWDLNIENIVEAFRKEYPNTVMENVVTESPKKNNERHSPSTPHRPQRSQTKSRTRSERRSGAAFAHNSDTRENQRAPTTQTTCKGASLSLGTVLMDMARYVPFVESRLAFFRAKCEAAAVNCTNGDGSAGDLLREWFAKSQLISLHLEKLIGGAKMAGMTKHDACVSLVPLEKIAAKETEEVGSFFKSQAVS